MLEIWSVVHSQPRRQLCLKIAEDVMFWFKLTKQEIDSETIIAGRLIVLSPTAYGADTKFRILKPKLEVQGVKLLTGIYGPYRSFQTAERAKIRWAER